MRLTDVHSGQDRGSAQGALKTREGERRESQGGEGRGGEGRGGEGFYRTREGRGRRAQWSRKTYQ